MAIAAGALRRASARARCCGAPRILHLHRLAIAGDAARRSAAARRAPARGLRIVGLPVEKTCVDSPDPAAVGDRAPAPEALGLLGWQWPRSSSFALRRRVSGMSAAVIRASMRPTCMRAPMLFSNDRNSAALSGPNKALICGVALLARGGRRRACVPDGIVGVGAPASLSVLTTWLSASRSNSLSAWALSRPSSAGMSA